MFFDASWDPTTDSVSMSGIYSLPHQPVMYYDLTNTSLQHTFPTVASAIIPQWSGQALYFVLLALTGLTQSTSRQYLTYPCSGVNTHGVQMKTKLQSGEIVVTGDQWPLFLYADYHYDPDDPWIFRSALLVCV